MAVNNMNQVMLIGNLTKEPELKETSTGKSVCELRLANNNSYKKGDDWETRANFFQISVWGKPGENAAKYLDKGSKVAISGRLEWQSWPSADDPNKMNSRVVIIANSVEYLSNTSKDTNTDNNSSDDDIPF